MDTTSVKADIGESIVTQNYLTELLSRAIELETNASEKKRERHDASKELDTLSFIIYQAVENEVQLKRKINPLQQRTDRVHEQPQDTRTSFAGLFNHIQKIMGISVVCVPNRKLCEITFDDAVKTKVCVAYNDKGLMLEEMVPAHPNIESIRIQLRETGDLIGLLAVLRKKLILSDA